MVAGCHALGIQVLVMATGHLHGKYRKISTISRTILT